MSTDPMWCYDNYGEAAEYIDELEEKVKNLQQEVAMLNKEILYEVVYGPKKESEREKKVFSNSEAAYNFFKQKEKKFHVDVYKIITTYNRIKLTHD